MTFLATFLIFGIFFLCCGIGYLIAQKAFRGCACHIDPNDPSTPCCKAETENESKKNSA